jgi:hypothetical protein
MTAADEIRTLARCSCAHPRKQLPHSRRHDDDSSDGVLNGSLFVAVLVLLQPYRYRSARDQSQTRPLAIKP